jgi:cobalt-zinc-cadmium efflux system membrane fusion protein
MNTRTIHVVWLAGLALTGCGVGGDVKKQPDSAVRVEASSADEIVLGPESLKLRQIRVAEVEVKQVALEEVRAPGKVELDPNRVSHLLMPVPGRIREVLVKLGDAVSEGQTILLIESPEAVTAATAHRHSLAELRQARSAQAKAEKDLARIKDLYEHRAAALKDVSNAENDLTQAQTAVEQVQAQEEEARQRLAMLGLQPDGNPGTVAVHAPIRGKVLEIGVAPGEYRLSRGVAEP